MASEVKRMRYFDGLFLKEEEFNLDQDYHQRMRRLHNRHLHGFGIVRGLDVELQSSTQVVVRQGMAIDKFFDTDNAEEIGREILVPVDRILNVTGAPNTSVYLYVYYAENAADVVEELGGPTEGIHWQEGATLEFAASPPDDVEENLILARIDIKNDGTIDSDSIVYEENGESLRIILEPPTGGGTVVVTGGEGKNYVLNPDAEADLTNWTAAASGNLTVAATAVPGEILAGTMSFRIAATASVAQTTDYVAIALAPIDEEDKNQLLAVEFSYKGLSAWAEGNLRVVVRDTTNDVDIIPTPSLVPGGQSKYRGTFFASDSATYELRLVAGVDALAFAVAVDSVRVSPHQLTVGPAISGWTPYDLQITATGSPPAKATSPDVDQAFWRRVGDSMEIVYSYRHTNNAGAQGGSGTYLFALPQGYSIDPTRVAIGTNELTGVVGSAAAENSGHNSAGIVKVYDESRLAIIPDSSGDTVFGYNFVSNLNFPLSNTTAGHSFRATVPIAEWQSDVVLSQSRTEYVYNGDTSENDNTSNFATGEIGGRVPNLPGGTSGYEFNTAIRKRVRLSRRFKHVALEFDEGGNGVWTATGRFNRMVVFNSTADFMQPYGAILEPVTGSQNEWDVVFYGNATLDDTRSNVGWDAEFTAGTRWRVVASDNPFFVESSDTRPVSAVGAWIDAGAMTFKGTGSDPTYGSITHNRLLYRRVGDTMEFVGQFDMTTGGGPGSGEYYLELPDGFNADLSKVEIETGHVGSTNWGQATIHFPGDEISTGYIHFLDSRKFSFHTERNNSSTPPFGPPTWTFANAGGVVISFQGKVPIAEWTHDVVLRESLTEYVYNSDDSDGDDTTNFATGEVGGLVPNRPLKPHSFTEAIRKRIKTSRPFKHVALEFDEDGRGAWSSSSKFTRLVVFDGNSLAMQPYGALLEAVAGSNTEWDVVFYGHAVLESDNSSTPWQDERTAGTRWRVVASDNPFFVEAPDPRPTLAIGGWIPFDLEITSTGSAPSKAPAPDIDMAHWRRVGDSMEILYSYRHTTGGGANGTGDYLFSIPDGFTIDETKIVVHNSSSATRAVCGVATADGLSIDFDALAGAAHVFDDTHLCISGTHSTDNGIIGATRAGLGNSEVGYSFQATIPIAQWQSDVILRENLTEYVSNGSSADADDLTSFVTGEAGSLVPPVATSDWKTRVRFSRKFKHYRLEFQENGIGPWLPAGETRFGLIRRGGSATGMDGAALIPVNNTDFDVHWTSDGAANLAGTTNTWGLERTNLTRWRVVGSDNPLMVETPEATQGNVVGPWIQYQPELTGLSGNPTRATTHSEKAYWRRVGDSMEIMYSYYAADPTGSAPGASSYAWSLPPGHTIDTSKVHTGFGSSAAALGSASLSNTGGTNPRQAYAFAWDANTFGIAGLTAGDVVTPVGNGYFTINGPDTTYTFQARVPIAEWQGHDVVLAESRVEYAYNLNTTSSDDTTSFTQGEAGGPVPSFGVVGSSVAKRVQFSRKFKHYSLEFDRDGSGFFVPVGQDRRYHWEIYQDGSGYGAHLQSVSDTQVDVVFAGNGSEATVTWADENTAGTLWRVVGSDNPALVESPEPYQGNVVGPWTLVGPIGFKGTIFDPSPGTTTVDQLKYRRVGESMEIAGQFKQTAGGTQGSGTFYIEIPEGLHSIDTTPATNNPAENTWGTAQIHENGTKTGVGAVQLLDNRSLALITWNTGASGLQFFDSSGWSFSTNNTFDVSFHASIPIAEWADQSVILSESRVEYVANSDPANADDTSSFVTAEEGELVPDVSGGISGYKTKRVQFSRPFKHVVLEVKPDGHVWMPAAEAGYTTFHDNGVARYGVQLQPISPTEVDVRFANAGRSGFNEIAWLTERNAGTRWRVVGSDNPALVQAPEPEFYTADSQLLATPSGVYWYELTGNSLTLPPGTWQLTGCAQFSGATSGWVSDLNARWATENGGNQLVGNPPAILPVLSGNPETTYPFGTATDTHQLPTNLVIFKNAAPATVYLVPGGSLNTPANGVVAAFLTAIRLA